METPLVQNPDKVKNSNLSIALIVLNVVLAFGFSLTIEGTGESKNIISFLCILAAAIVSLAIYSFAYQGEGYRWAKWLLGICFLVALATLVIFYVLAF